MRKKFKNIFFILSIFVIFTMIFNMDKVMGTDIGSYEDPLVSKSYVDSQIKEVMDLVETIVSNQNSDSDSNKTISYEVVNVSAGEKLVGGQGTEIILRGGKGLAIASSYGGLQDITEGIDIAGGTQIPKYHLIIIPREDGRGIYVESDAVFMVRGDYEILP
ncbi:hypothetical protein [Defluviitalea phaphyphila]|uniref:hypothetical protein n=1 Tax=Defluviitalea phaphyphila TaxID=1473580 RepID=UPI000731A8AB|nr:hypothetical protein [Defluviitalea phaphyphila]